MNVGGVNKPDTIFFLHQATIKISLLLPVLDLDRTERKQLLKSHL